jgi:hypothetical protein
MAGISEREVVSVEDQARTDAENRIADSVAESVKGYKLGADVPTLTQLGLGSEEATKALRDHVFKNFEGTDAERATLNRMISGKEFLDFAQAGAGGLGWNKASVALNLELDRRAEGAQAYNKYKDTVGGAGVEELLSNSGIRGAAELGAHVEKMIQGMAGRRFDPGEEATAFEQIRNMAVQMDPDEAFEVSQALNKIAEDSGNPEIARIAMTAGSAARFRSRNKADLKHAGRAETKVKLISSMFGGTDKVKEALGLAGSKEHREYIKDYVKTVGDLPTSAKQALTTARKYDLQMAGMNPALAGADIADLPRFFDKEGVSGEQDLVKAGRIAETSEMIAHSRPGGGSGNQKFNEVVNDFSRKLGEATGAVQKFTAGLGGSPNNQGANPGPTNSSDWGSSAKGDWE